MTLLGLLLFVVASHMDAATVNVTGSLTTAHYSTKDSFTLASFDVQIATIVTCIAYLQKMTPLGLLLFVVASHMEAEDDTATVTVTGV